MQLDVVGPAEVAAMLQVSSKTVSVWRLTEKLPRPDAVLAQGVVWRRTTIARWAEKEGREVHRG